MPEVSPVPILTRLSGSRENAENMYFFSELALTLNEPEERVAPTDSRLRPDQRLMESGRWDEANVEKQRLEEKQRAVRRRREAEAVEALEEGEVLWVVQDAGTVLPLLWDGCGGWTLQGESSSGGPSWVGLGHLWDPCGWVWDTCGGWLSFWGCGLW